MMVVPGIATALVLGSTIAITFLGAGVSVAAGGDVCTGTTAAAAAACMPMTAAAAPVSGRPCLTEV
jgi:hypothetical protein